MPYGNQFFGNTRTAPVWAGDFGGREHIMPYPAKIDPTAYLDFNGIQVTVTAIAAQSATTIAVTALTIAQYSNTVLIAAGNVLIPAGTTLDFGGAKFARLTADAVIGATSLTVAALPTALAIGDTTAYSKYATETLPSGLFVGRTYAERDAGTPFGIAAPGSDDEMFLTYFDVSNAKLNNDIELYRPGSLVKENYLPFYTTLLNPGVTMPTTQGGMPSGGTASATLIKIRSLYKCIVGVD